MKKILANIGWIFIDKVFRMIAGILVGIWVARYLGPVDFGVLNYAILFPTIFIPIAGLGLTSVLMIEYIAVGVDQNEKKLLLNTAFILKLLSGLITFCLIISLNYILNYNNQILYTLIIITSTSLLFQNSDVIDVYFQSQTKAKIPVIVKLVAFTIVALIRIYALLNHSSIKTFALLNTIELAISFIIMLFVYNKYFSSSIIDLFTRLNKSMAYKLLKISWPLMLTELFIYVYMRLDQYMIKYLSNSVELGLYSAALRLSETWYFVAIAITTSFYPKIAETWDSDRDRFYKHYQQMLNLLIYISVFIAIVSTFLSDKLISFLYGKAYEGAGNILSIHIWAGIFVYIGIGCSNLFIINNLQQFALWRTVAGSLINIGLNFWLIPRYGAAGASVATLIAQFCSAYGLNFFYHKAKPIFYIQSKAFVDVLKLKFSIA